MAQAVAPSSATESCSRLVATGLTDGAGMPVDFAAIPEAPTRLTSAKLVDAAADVPAFCHVIGYVAPTIGIDLRLPVANWNGKFAMIGCGGMCGAVPEQGCEVALIKGYACIQTDMGHRSTQTDAEWAYNNLQGEVDFGFRATHVVAVAGKFVTEVYYRKSPALSYFLGCSTGGRQGFVEAQKFPFDFNGILAGAPPLNEMGDGLDIIWTMQHTSRADGTPLLTKADLALVTAAALKLCDTDDGVRDGVISLPTRCAFDPRSMICKPGATGCLSAEQAAALAEIYRGPHDSKGMNWYHGLNPGSEPIWAGNLQRDDGSAPTYIKFMTSQFRFLAFSPDKGPGFTLDRIDWDKDPQRTLLNEALMNAQNPDLRRFKAAGGKLLSYHGWNDHTVQPGASTDYYETVERTMGGRKATQDFYRLFMVPGMDHCQTGSGATAIDFLTAIENWVEHGQAPERIIAAKPRDPKDGVYPRGMSPAPAIFDTAIFTRPLVPYPLHAVWTGRGDANDAKNFVAKQ